MRVKTKYLAVIFIVLLHPHFAIAKGHGGYAISGKVHEVQKLEDRIVILMSGEIEEFLLQNPNISKADKITVQFMYGENFETLLPNKFKGENQFSPLQMPLSYEQIYFLLLSVSGKENDLVLRRNESRSTAAHGNGMRKVHKNLLPIAQFNKERKERLAPQEGAQRFFKFVLSHA